MGLKCEFCHLIFDSPRVIEMHQTLVHASESIQNRNHEILKEQCHSNEQAFPIVVKTVKSKVTCKMCKKDFTSKFALVKHKNLCTRIHAAEEEIIRRGSSAEDEPMKSFPCVCKKSFTQEIDFEK